MTACPAAGSRATSRIGNGDVEPAADVDEPVVARGQPLVAGRAQLLDQPVLEHQRRQLGARDPVVDDGRVRGPAGRGASTARSAPGPGCGSRPTCRRRGRGRRRRGTGTRPGRAGSSANSGSSGLPPGRTRRPVADAAPRRAAWAAAGAQSSASASATEDGVRAQPREQGAQHPRARLGVGQRPVGLVDLDPERVGQHPESPLALQREHRPGQRGGADDRRVRASPARSASNAWRSTRRSNGALWATITRPRSSSPSVGQHRLQRRAPRRPSPG